MAVTLQKLKSYLRIDTDYEDDLLNETLKVARAYLSGAVSNYYNSYATYPEFASKADLLTLVIAAELYENRDNSAHDMSYTVRTMITQLQYFAGAAPPMTYAMFDANGNLVDSKIYATRENLFGGTGGTPTISGGTGDTTPSGDSGTQTVDEDNVATDDEANDYFDSIFNS